MRSSFGNKVIFTAIFGNYDDLKEPTIVTPGWQYLCYTDQPLKSKVWNIVQVSYPMVDQMNARLTKIFGSEEFKQKSIWVDASFTISCNLDQFYNTHFKSPITFMRHPWRDCFYDEAKACIDQGRGDRKQIQAQVKQYQLEGLPRNNGVASTGVVLFESSEANFQFCLLWFQKLKEGSIRDQLSLCYVTWKMPDYHIADWDYTQKKDFIFKPHLHKRIL